MGERLERKIERLDELEFLLLQHPEGLTKAEIARRLQVHRSTAAEYIDDLGKRVVLYEPSEGKYAIDREAYKVRVQLTLHESLAVHLAARLLTTRTDKHNPHAASALRKLGVALEKLAPRISQHLALSADVLDDSSRRRDPVFLQILETLTRAWSLGKKVHLTHEMDEGKIFEYDFAPYFIEPYAVGRTLHVIGLREPLGKVRTFKVENIRTAHLLENSVYEIPPEFDAREILKDAWGIWYTERKPEPVVLRFTRQVAPRVRQTQWHHTERTQEEADGSLLWRAEIAEWQEMVPWVRGWGSDVEVMEPEGLRGAIVKEVKRMARKYAIDSIERNAPSARVLRLWGKTGKIVDEFHPAVFHMLDVGNVARALLNHPHSARWRNTLADAFQVEPVALVNWMPYLVALHDIGKISMAFQALNAPQKARLEQENFSFAGWRKDSEMYHATISQAYMVETLAQEMGVSLKILNKAFGEALGGHHGQFVDPDVLKRVRQRLKQEDTDWQNSRNAADAILRAQFFQTAFAQMASPPHLSKAIMALTGFTIFCDWLGSDARYFAPAPETELEKYIGESNARAQRVVREAGVVAPNLSDASIRVETLFADLGTLRPLQLAINEISDDLLRGATLTIMEAPTGEGKTEAALALARRIGHLNGTDEMYYALPTMATSNQMFRRLEKHLRERLGLASSVKLVHGQSFLLEAELRAETPMALSEPLENGGEEKGQARASMEWFNSKKRALLAPFGVGTIDQAELASLNVNHAALRMMGLAGKVVIVDEVHAYDTYMTTIVARLLRWLATMNTSVILLSATLPVARRKQLMDEYRKGLAAKQEFELSGEQARAYPNLVTVGTNQIFQTNPQVWQPHRVIELAELHFGDGDSDARAKAEWLLRTIEQGGCVCWMTNTVKRAQKIFKELLTLALSDVKLDLLHSQFPLDERQAREMELSETYGKDKTRPIRGIVVGTQVLEQSLDLDFDVMVSDLAPIDLLLQRAGRLHRHTRERPSAHALPRLHIDFELDAEGKLNRGTDKTIYAEYIMRQTHHVLKERTQIVLPRDYRELIEAVYSEIAPAEESEFHEAWLALTADKEKAEGEAKKRLLPAPDAEDSFAEIAASARILFEEDENRADFIVAQTRLSEETMNVIVLEREGDWVMLEGTNARISTQQEAAYETQRALLRRNLRISNRELMAALRAERSVKLFSESTLLKNYFPLWLSNGAQQFQVNEKTLRVTLHQDLGLVIEKEGKTNDTTE